MAKKKTSKKAKEVKALSPEDVHYPGMTWTLDIYNVGLTFEEMEDESLMMDKFKKCVESGFNVLEYFQHKIEPQGMELLASIIESHVALATWPELKFIAVDIFTCGNVDGRKIINAFLREFEVDMTNHKNYDVMSVPRGRRLNRTLPPHEQIKKDKFADKREKKIEEDENEQVQT